MKTILKEIFLQKLERKYILISIFGVLLMFAYIWVSIFPGVKSLAAVEGDYVYTIDGGEATITEYNGGWGSVVIPETLGGYSVVGIGENAFSERKGLTNLTIPDSVVDIHWAAFIGCESLTRFVVDENNPEYSSLDGVLFNKDQTILVQYPPNRYGPYTIPSSVVEIGNNGFADAVRLSEITIPSGITTIGGGAFQGCAGFTSISIPDTVTSIGEIAFWEDDNLTQFTVDPNNPNYSSENGVLFNKAKTILKQYPASKSGSSYSIPNTVTDMDNYAFNNATLLNTVTIPEGVINLGNNTFHGCTGLTNMTIPNSAVSIPGGLFGGCENLANVTLGSGITSIGNYAFNECKDLTSITIPEGVTSIGISAFQDNISLTSVSIPDSVTSIGDYAFNNARRITNFNIGSGLNSIGNYVFQNCNELNQFNVDINNAAYSSDEGVLFNKTKTILMRYPPKKSELSYTVPNTVTNIANNSFLEVQTLQNVTIQSGVTRIGGGAFQKSPKLSSISIPDTVTSIGEIAFWEDDNLTQFTVDPNNPNYSSENGVLFNKAKTILKQYPASKSGSSYSIPNTVTDMDNYAFNNATLLNTVTIPEGVINLGNNTFHGCTGLTNMTIPNSAVSIPGGLFGGCENLANVTLGSGITSIGNYAFNECKDLTSITIPEGVTSIGISAFQDNISLTSVSIPDSVTSIGNYAFYNCKSLESIAIPESVTTIGVATFYKCSELVSVTMGNNVTSIGGSAFRECSSLENMNIPATVTSIGDYAFFEDDGMIEFVVDSANTKFSSQDGVLFNKAKTILKQYPASKSGNSYTIPNTVTSLENAAFLNAKNLTSITIPNTITTMGNSTFSGCSRLNNVVIPNSITSIGGGVFKNCTSLTNITIPDTIVSIGAYAFQGCTSLISVNIPESLVTLDDGAFQNCSNLVEAHFLGNAPTTTSGISLFRDDDPNFKIYYLGGRTGWTNPWHGYPTVGPVSYPSSSSGSVDIGSDNVDVGDDESMDFSAGTSDSMSFSNYSGGDLSGQNLDDVMVGNEEGMINVDMDKGVQINTASDYLVINNSDLTGSLVGATVTVANGTTVFGPSEWDGTIIPPKIGNPKSSPKGLSLGKTVLDFGSTNTTLLLDKPALIIINQSVASLYYQLSGSSLWNKIQQCQGNFINPVMPNFPGECYIKQNNPATTKIYTYHLTTYAEGIIPPSYSTSPQEISGETGEEISEEIIEDEESPVEAPIGVKTPEENISSLNLIQNSPIPSFNLEWGIDYFGGRSNWALAHRTNIYYLYINLLGRIPTATEVNWWLQYSGDISHIENLFLVSEEYLNKK